MGRGVSMKFAKLLLLSIALGSLTAEAKLHVCVATEFAQNGGTNWGVDSYLYLQDVLAKDGNPKLTKDGALQMLVSGHVLLKGKEDWHSPRESYYSLFVDQGVVQNLNYKPRKYKEHIQFPKLTETASNGTDGGGLNGEFIVSKDMFRESKQENKFEAHFIFQSGDHMGGVIHYSCVN
jgi:hypothetical protein